MTAGSQGHASLIGLLRGRARGYLLPIVLPDVCAAPHPPTTENTPMFIPAVAQAARREINTLQTVVPRILEIGAEGKLGNRESVRLANKFEDAMVPLSQFITRQVGEGSFPAVMGDHARDD